MIRLLFLAIILARVDFSSAADWPQWRGPNYDGITSELIPAELPEALPILWKAQLGTGFSSVSVLRNRLLTMGNRDATDTVWCLDSNSGEVIWTHRYACDLAPLYYEGGTSATPTIHEGSVYTLSKMGHAFRLDLETGAVIWSRDLVADHDLELPQWNFAGSPFVHEQRLILHAGRGGIALDRNSGKTLWLPSQETAGYSTVVPFPAGKPSAGYLLFSAKALIAFDIEDGSAAWSFRSKSSSDVNAADPLVRGKNIVLSSSSGTVMLEAGAGPQEPKVVWEQKDLKWYFNPGVLVGEHIYSIHGTTHRPTELTCTDFTTGATLWAEEGFGSGGLMAAGNTIVLFDQGTLTLFDASSQGFKPRLQQKILDGTSWTVPVLANGRIYVRNAAGDLACATLTADRSQ